MTKLYRVKTESTGSVQPGRGSTTWRTDAVHYVGQDVAEARVAYHEHEPHDSGGSYGNPTTRTVFEVLDTSELPDDDPGDDWQPAA